MQLEKGDSLTEGYTSELWDFACINVTQNNLQELKEIWSQWDDEVKQLFYYNYGDLPYLLDIKVDKHLLRALAQFWNFAHSCFTFTKVDLVPTVEDYTALLRCPRIQADKAYSRAVNVLNFIKKGEIKPLGHIDNAVLDLFDRLDRTPVLTILAETSSSLNACQRTGEGRFIGCAQLLLAWFHSHFWKVDRVSYRVFFENYSLLKELVVTLRHDDIRKMDGDPLKSPGWRCQMEISLDSARRDPVSMWGL
ncbi:hypothetical protein Godav_028976 [Gossypium davidsonii]|uniref:DUF7745 domain-containing protein n=1 Tax=Gossypium davidsonii TaxID=34287 RepID=A0A7J8TAE4_GOSDV|nr:hypothetical protein [Gossypium davidsonii]